MNWTDRTSPIKVGDEVGFKPGFLEDFGHLPGEMPQARGTVTAMEDNGTSRIATVEWQSEDTPQRVNVANLRRMNEQDIQPSR